VSDAHCFKRIKYNEPIQTAINTIAAQHRSFNSASRKRDTAFRHTSIGVLRYRHKGITIRIYKAIAIRIEVQECKHIDLVINKQM